MKKLVWMFSSLLLFLALVQTQVGLVQAQGFEELGSFRTTSNNIHCLVYRESRSSSAELQCELITVTARIPPKPRDCDLDWGQRFYLPQRGRPERVCHGDTIVGRAKVLAYGETWRMGGLAAIPALCACAASTAVGAVLSCPEQRRRFFRVVARDNPVPWV